MIIGHKAEIGVKGTLKVIRIAIDDPRDTSTCIKIPAQPDLCGQLFYLDPGGVIGKTNGKIDLPAFKNIDGNGNIGSAAIHIHLGISIFCKGFGLRGVGNTHQFGEFQLVIKSVALY